MQYISTVQINTKGQLVIPKKIRDHLNITVTTPLTISFKGDVINILPPHSLNTDTTTSSTGTHWIDEYKSVRTRLASRITTLQKKW